MNKPLIIEPNQQVTAWERVEAALLRHHHEPDLQAARIVYSAVAAHRLPGFPVWPMLVAPPGSMKTELLGGMDGISAVHFIDAITPQTFISGQIAEPGEEENKKSASLLHRIGKQGMIIYPDFSTVLGMKSENKATILADMRRIYDGQLRKEFGTADQLVLRPPEDLVKTIFMSNCFGAYSLYGPSTSADRCQAKRPEGTRQTPERRRAASSGRPACAGAAATG